MRIGVNLLPGRRGGLWLRIVATIGAIIGGTALVVFLAVTGWFPPGFARSLAHWALPVGFAVDLYLRLYSRSTLRELRESMADLPRPLPDGVEEPPSPPSDFGIVLGGVAMVVATLSALQGSEALVWAATGIYMASAAIEILHQRRDRPEREIPPAPAERRRLFE
jgi:hypothetical protein